MFAVRLTNFQATAPKLDPRLLVDSAAQVAQNCILTSGALRPVYAPYEVGTVRSANVETIFRMYSGATSYWLNWESDVDVARGPITGDTSFRIYFTSADFEPRVTNLAMATASTPYPASWYVLGVTPPVTAPTATPTGGSGTLESRAYVYTFVTQWGEESAPSPASSIASGYPDATWAISGMDTAPPNSYAISAASWSGGTLSLTFDSVFGLRAGEYVTVSGLAPSGLNTSMKVVSINTGTKVVGFTIADPGTITDQSGTATRDAPHNTTGMTKRVYRSVTTDTDTDYYFTKEIAVATTSTNDDVGSAIGEPLPTSGWVMPPADLHSVKAHPSGALVGISGNSVCFSEPFAPYAWPAAYAVTMNYPGVGLGVIGQSVVACTEGRPYLVTGVEPASMSAQHMEAYWPCLTKRGIAAVGGYVMYPTNLGLAYIGPDGNGLITENFYTQVEWERETPSGFLAASYDGKYFARTVDASNVHKTLVISPKQGVSTLDFDPMALYTDAATGELYAAYDSKVYQWNADKGQRLTYLWTSKEFVVPDPLSIGAVKFDLDVAVSAEEQAAIVLNNAAAIATNTTNLSSAAMEDAVGTFEIGEVEVAGDDFIEMTALSTYSLVFRFYVDGDLYYETDVSNSLMFRLPAGRKYDNFYFSIEGDTPVRAVVIADTAANLKTV